LNQIVSLVSRHGLKETTLLTVACRELNMQYPGRYTLYVYSNYPELFAESPHITNHGSLDDSFVGKVIEFRFDIDSKVHQLVGVLDELDYHLRTDTKLTEFRPALFLDKKMRETPPSKGGKLEGKPYWLFATGGGYDNTVARLDRTKWQAIVSRLAVREDFPLMVNVGASDDVYHCRKLKDCVDLHGRTNLRELIWLVQHSSGIITTGTFLAHVAAALRKPCVVLAGGHKSRWHEGYTTDVISAYCRVEKGDLETYADVLPHRFLDVTGTKDCCRDTACHSYSLGECGSAGLCKDLSVRDHYSKGNLARQSGCMSELDINWVVNAVRWEDHVNRECRVEL
jgi:ADP-heptose:LPS heptosyltransferase